MGIETIKLEMWIENGLALSSQIYLGLFEPVTQINVILQISICSEGKTGSPLHRCVLVCVSALACVCLPMNLYLYVCVCAGHLCQQI